MPLSAAVVVDRRVAQRFQTSVEADLASGNRLVTVTVHDMSMTGCGVEVMAQDADVADALGATGVLLLPPAGNALSGAILPVMLCNMRVEDGRLMYGLQFRRLLPHQTRKLVEIMHAVIPE